MSQASERPTVRLEAGRHRRVLDGHPWAYSNEVRMDAAAKALPPGTVVRLAAPDSRPVGTGFFNPHSLIAMRLLSADPAAAVDEAFLFDRLARALALREALFTTPHYRLVHAEADGLPGLVIDRFGDVLVCQQNAAGMELLRAPLLAALGRLLRPAAIVLRNDAPVRLLEGLAQQVEVAAGTLPATVEAVEDGARFPVDAMAGQKTGWFYDQRDNRTLVARLARGRRVGDFYSHTGGFAVRAALAGAASVLAVDRSEPSLALAGAAARLNGVEAKVNLRRAKAFDELERLVAAGERFDLLVADPPAFVKSRKEFQSGVRGYRKLARLAAAATAPEGFLFLASCSQAVEPERFLEECRRGVAEAGRIGRILHRGGAGPDHPLHPALPESAYLKSVLWQLD